MINLWVMFFVKFRYFDLVWVQCGLQLLSGKYSHTHICYYSFDQLFANHIHISKLPTHRDWKMLTEIVQNKKRAINAFVEFQPNLLERLPVVFKFQKWRSNALFLMIWNYNPTKKIEHDLTTAQKIARVDTCKLLL
jgi:hypothetical protein